MNHYDKLQQKLDQHPVGAPASKYFREILKYLFQPEELDIALSLEFSLEPVEDIVSRIGLEEEEVSQKLEVMADRGVVLAKTVGEKTYYALLPNYPGLFEYPIMKGMEKEKQQELSRLWHIYYMESMGERLAEADPPWNRIFPAEEAINEEYEILPYEVASEMMEQTRTIALAECPCRITGGQCENPLDVCLSFDGAAQFLAERGMARLINREEARNVLKRAEEAGLVHTGSNNAGKLLFICNCCPCCCHFLMLHTHLRYREALATSSYEAELDVSSCTGCGICAEERCPTGALSLDGDMAVLDRENCIGCGLCVTTCSGEALKLVKREDHRHPPDSVQDLVQNIVVNRKKRNE